MANNFPAAPSDLQVSEVMYYFRVNYDTSPYGVQFGMQNFSVDYNFLRQNDNGTYRIDSSLFNQSAVEAGVQQAVAEICSMIAGFTGAPINDVYATAQVSRVLSWTSPALLNSGDSPQPTISTQDSITFVPPSS